MADKKTTSQPTNINTSYVGVGTTVLPVFGVQNSTTETVPKKKWYDVAGTLLDSLSNLVNGLSNTQQQQDNADYFGNNNLGTQKNNTTTIVVIVGILIVLVILFLIFKKK